MLGERKWPDKLGMTYWLISHSTLDRARSDLSSLGETSVGYIPGLLLYIHGLCALKETIQVAYCFRIFRFCAL